MTRLAIVLVAVLASCGVASPTIEGVDIPADGPSLFEAKALGHRPGCVTCHALEPDVRIVGPSLAGVGERAGSRVDGMDAASYLRQSIVDTDAYVVEGFPDGLMPNDYVTILDDDQIAALVDFLEAT